MAKKVSVSIMKHKAAVVVSIIWAVLAVFSYVVMIWDTEAGFFNDYKLYEQVVSGSIIPKLFIAGLFVFGLFLIWFQEIKRFPMPVLALGCTLIFGLGYILLSPVQNGFDENAHFFKTLATLDGRFLKFSDYSYEISDSYILTRDHMHVLWFDAMFSQPWMQTRTWVDGLTNGFLQCTYPPYGYLFCCMGCGLGILLNLSTGFVLFMGRFFNLLGFLLLAALALKILPKDREDLKAGLALAAGIPGLVFNSSMITQDGMIFGLAFILIALTVKLRESRGSSLFLLFALLYLLLIPLRYPFIVFGFLLFLVPKERFPKGRKGLCIIFLAVLAILLAASYFFLVSEQFGEIRVEGTNAKQQILYVITHLPHFTLQVISSFLLQQPWLKMIFLGNQDGYYISTQLLFMAGYVLLFFWFFIIPKKSVLKKPEKWLVAGVIALGSFLTYFALYCTYNPLAADEPISGVQGRYFFPLLALLPLLSPERPLLSDAALNKAEEWQLAPMLLLILHLYGFCAMMYFI